jgi:hypothetical protein
MLLRLPKLIVEIKEKKQWSFDWINVAAIGIPSIYIAMIPLLSLFTFFGMNWLFAKELILLGDTTLTTIAGIVFGYVLLDSLKKITPLQVTDAFIEERVLFLFRAI